MEDNKNKKVLNVPTLRFPEFNKNGAWTHKKIFDMGEIVTGTTPSTKIKEYYSNGKYLWVTPTDICGKEITTTNQKLTELGLKKGRKIQKNSILVTCVASIGKNCILREAGSCNQQINAIAVNNIHNIDFVYYLMENSVSMLHKYSSKGGMEILNKDVFSNLIVYTPNIEEQSKIANFLSLIDKIIELQNKIIKDYKLLKKETKNRIFAKLLSCEKRHFLEIFTPFIELNNNDYPQYTIGKQGLLPLPIESQKYNKKHHIVFKENTCIFGIGINEVGVSIDTIGCCSPIYKVYSINGKIIDTYFLQQFINKYLMLNINKITKKSTRREFEIDNSELLKISFNIPNLWLCAKLVGW